MTTPDTMHAMTFDGASPVLQLRRVPIPVPCKPMAVVWAMGITQHTSGVLNVLALANLQMRLGNVGVRGGGVNPLRGQNNVQGACDMGALPNVFADIRASRMRLRGSYSPALGQRHPPSVHYSQRRRGSP